MSVRLPNFRSHVTLGLCTILHGFTHAYGTLLVPLYLSIVVDLHLSGVRQASLIVTLYGMVYCLGSLGAGVLADRFDRRLLLGVGLLGNAAAIVGIGLLRDYHLILAMGAVAGAFGTLFHPAANALAPSHYPKSPGMAIGLLGMGSGIGFFVGPQFAGWRARAATWHFLSVAPWQKPCIELGIAGIVVGLFFLLLAKDPHTQQRRQSRVAVDPALRDGVIRVACVLMLRDFVSLGGLSLAAIYLQRVFGMGVERTGLYVGLMTLPSILFNPVGVFLTPRQRRLPALAVVLISGGCVVLTSPLWGRAMILPILCLFQTLQNGSYALSDAAMLERVKPDLRGRVVGLFLLIAGTFGSLGPWVMGTWTDWLGSRASEPKAYFGPFGLLAGFMIAAAFATRFIARLGPPIELAPIRPFQEIMPATMEAAG